MENAPIHIAFQSAGAGICIGAIINQFHGYNGIAVALLVLLVVNYTTLSLLNRENSDTQSRERHK